MFSVRRVVGGALALAAAAAIATAANAAAEEPPADVAPADGLPVGADWDHTFKEPGVTVYVKENGDIISVCDTAANGYGASAWISSGSLSYSLKVTNGQGSCKTGRASSGENIAEGWVDIEFQGDAGTGYTRDFLNDH